MTVDVEAIKDFELFENLKEADLREFCQIVVSQRFAADQTIYRIGDNVRSILVVLSGRVRLYLPGKYGNPVALAHLSSGDIFGDMPDSQVVGCSINAVTLTETCLLTLNRDNLTFLFEKSPDAALRIIGAFEQRLQRTYRILASFGQNSTIT